ncbi:MAG: adenosylcobinamide-GDP ribazoletransferase [Rhodobacteraceae bacterium]|nr:MAG: adenosylcobinamide-GDP ribazoletransferase [Paracoccaceae bacterium]
MTETTDKLDLQAHDIWAAFSLLTRLPAPVDHARAGARAAAAVWAFPIVGLIVGGAAGGLAALAGWLGLPPGLAAASALAFLAVITGGMHEDGLADFADAMGGLTKERRLEIMKDSRIGAYGVVALTIALLARWSGIGELSGWAIIFILAAVGATSRAVMVLLMYAMPSARESGLSASVGKPNRTTVLVASGIAFIVCIAFTGLSGVVLFALVFGGALPVYWIANRTLGGQTGDVLGAAQQSAEIVGLAAAIALLT